MITATSSMDRAVGAHVLFTPFVGRCPTLGLNGPLALRFSANRERIQAARRQDKRTDRDRGRHTPRGEGAHPCDHAQDNEPTPGTSSDEQGPRQVEVLLYGE